MPLRALNNAAHTRLRVRHTYGNIVRRTQTQSKDVTSGDEMYIVVDRSQIPAGLWEQMTLSRVKWGGADSHQHRVGCLPHLASGHSCIPRLKPCRTPSNQAVLQVPKIRPHRNPVQGSNSMWLLCAGTQHPGLPIKGRTNHSQEVCCLPRRARSMEPPVPDQEGRDGQGKVRV
jgi:hypothetical protein